MPEPVTLFQYGDLGTLTTHQQIVDDALVRPGECPEFGGEREGQHKVRGRYLFAQLPFQPLLTLVVLTVGAVAMAAGVRAAV